MLVRLLLVLLVSVGQIPLCVCACATADGHPAIGSAPGEHDHGDCPLDVPDGSPAGADPEHDHGARHNPDCPAVNPRPAVAPSPAVHAEAIGAELSPAADHPPSVLGTPHHGTGSVRHPPGEPPVPLFISLLVLRI